MQALLDRIDRSIDDAVLTTPEKHALVADLSARPWRIDQLRQRAITLSNWCWRAPAIPSQSASMPALVKWLNDVVKVLDQVAAPVVIETEVWFSPGAECRAAVIMTASKTFLLAMLWA